MIGIDLLNNTGIQFIGDRTYLQKEQRTFIVVGVARGGTSLIAGTLHHLGLFGGNKSVAPVFEDVHLAKTFEDNELTKAQDIIKDYNIRYDTWFFKRPSSINYNKKLNNMCRNPIYLFIFKDIFAISNRNNISMKSDVLSGLNKAHDDYSKIIKFISKNDLNGFLFSYEKVMANKEFFVDLLVDLIGADKVTPDQKISALNFIEPNPKAYLNASRITRGHGQIGSVKQDRVIGWGKYIHSNEPATVELYINDKLVATTVAKDFRQGALDQKIHSTGHCGYLFDLGKSPLKDGDKISVKLEDDIEFLKNSNYVYKEK